MPTPKKRCTWATHAPELDQRYHDREWGRPVRDDRTLFEFLTLEGAQAGLSWSTILKKRESYRKAFAGFDPKRVARFTAKDQARLMKDAGIVRNRLKISSTVTNARAFLEVQKDFGSFSKFAWSFVDGKPIRPKADPGKHPRASSLESDAFSKALKERGFRFVGTTIMYAFMQACGLVDDHCRDCFRARK